MKNQNDAVVAENKAEPVRSGNLTVKSHVKAGAVMQSVPIKRDAALRVVAVTSDGLMF